MNEKKKAEENQKQLADLAAASSTEPDAGKKKPAKTGNKEISFGKAAPRFIGSQAAEFPSMAEADKMKKSPKKKGEKKPVEKKEPETKAEDDKAAAEPAPLPKFTNTKKKEETPAFVKLETEDKEHSHAAELISNPYPEKGPREFMIAGQEKPKEYREHKPYHGPRKQVWDEDKESRKERAKKNEQGKGGFKKGFKKDKAPAEKKDVVKEEKKVPKTGGAVAKFASAAPAGGAVWTLDALNDGK